VTRPVPIQFAWLQPWYTLADSSPPDGALTSTRPGRSCSLVRSDVNAGTTGWHGTDADTAAAKAEDAAGAKVEVTFLTPKQLAEAAKAVEAATAAAAAGALCNVRCRRTCSHAAWVVPVSRRSAPAVIRRPVVSHWSLGPPDTTEVYMSPVFSAALQMPIGERRTAPAARQIGRETTAAGTAAGGPRSGQLACLGSPWRLFHCCAAHAATCLHRHLPLAFGVPAGIPDSSWWSTASGSQQRSTTSRVHDSSNVHCA